MSERYRLVVNGLRRGQECGGGSLRLEAGQTAAPSCLLGLLAAPPTTPGPSPFRVSPAIFPPLKRRGPPASQPLSLCHTRACPTRRKLAPVVSSPSTRPQVYSKAHGHGPGVPPCFLPSPVCLTCPSAQRRGICFLSEFGRD